MNAISTPAPKAQLRLLGLLTLLASPVFAQSNPPPAVVVTVSSASIALGQPVTLAASLSLSGSPTGSVLFLDGATPLGYGTLDKGKGSFTTRSLPVGARSITARYNSYVSAAVTVTVTSVVSSGMSAKPVLPGYNSADAVTVADVNNDGYLDIITVDSFYGAVGISLGGPGAQFSTPVFFGAGTDPWNVVALDFNKDGKIDLAVMSDDGNVEILMGNGDGTFQAAVPYLINMTDDETVFVSAGDLNRDGNIDLVVTGAANLYVLFGNGDGTFTLQPNPLPIAYTGNMTVVADFNNDGIPDLATQDYNTALAHVYIGLGDGTFTTGAVVGTSLSDGSTAGIAVADLNNDGNLDIITAGSTTAIWLGDGTGAFAATTTIGDNGVISVAVGDVDGDGNLDVILGNNSGHLDINWGDGTGHFPDGNSINGPNDPYFFPVALAVGAFNGDGITGVIAVGGDQNDGLFLGSGPTGQATLTITNSGNFTQGQNGAQFTITASNTSPAIYTPDPATTLTDALTPGLTATSIAGNGWTCVLMSLTCTRTDTLLGNSSFPAITVTVNVDSDAPASLTNSALLTLIYTPETGDVTQVGRRLAPFGKARPKFGPPGPMPLVLAALDTVVAPLGVPLTAQTITFGALSPNIYTNAPITLGATASSLLNITFGVSGNCVVNGNMLTMLGTGGCSVTAFQAGNGVYAAATPVTRTFEIDPPVVTLTTNPTPTTTLGASVALTAHSTALTATGPVLFLDGTTPLGYAALSGGTATFTTTMLPAGDRYITASSGEFDSGEPIKLTVNPVVASALNAQPQIGALVATGLVLTADLNNDGHPDLVVLDGDDNLIWVVLGGAGGTFGTPVSYANVLNESMTLADLNEDGNLDIVVVGEGNVSVLLGNGDGTFQPASGSYPTGTQVGAITAADIDGDGNIDVVMTSDSDGVDILFGVGDGTFQPYLGGAETSIGAGAIRVADFNSDGVPDIVVQDPATGNVVVLLNNDDGTYSLVPLAPAPGVDYGIGLAVNDFNHDGNADIAVGGYPATQIYLSNGDGTFQTGSVVTPSNPVSITSGDFNGDGKVDLLFGDFVSCTMSSLDVFTGDGTGNFAYAYSSNPGSDEDPLPNSFAVADFNGDGRTDVVTAGFNAFITPYFGGLAVPVADLNLAKSHTGNFTQGQTGATYSLVVSNVAGVPTTGVITVTDTLPSGLTASGASGTGWVCTLAISCTRSDALAVSSSYPAITVTVNVAGDAAASVTNTATVSGAIALDVLTTANDVTTITPVSGPSSQTISFSVLPDRAASGSFTVSATATSSLPVTFTVSGNCTIAGSIVTITGAGSCTVTANQAGNGSYAAATPVSQTFAILNSLILTTSASPAQLGSKVTLTATISPTGTTGVVLFFNGATPLGYGTLASGVATFTSKLLPAGIDSVSASYGGLVSNKVSVTVAALAATGLAPQPPITGFTQADNVAVADLNDDGIIDLITADYAGSRVGISLGTGGGQFSPPVFYSTPSPYAMVVVDVNGDGFPDIVAADYNTGSLYVLLGNGDGTFQTPVISPATAPTSLAYMATGDFNGDGKIDLIATSDQFVTVFLGNGDGTFTAQSPVDTGNAAFYVRVADFNSDGKTDFVVQDNQAIAHVFLGNGDGTFTAGASVGASQDGGRGLVVGDFNNDGIPDIVAGGFTTALFLGNGDGTFTAAGTFTETTPYGLASGDFNGDGKLDLVVLNGDTLQFDTYFGNGAGAFSAGFSSPPPGVSDPEFFSDLFSVADLNGDGLSDIVVGGYDAYVVVYLGTPSLGLQVSEIDNGNFIAGQSASLSLTVYNGSIAATIGTITVVDSLPAGITASAISGTGWTCTLLTLTCTRSDALAIGLSYPPITVSVQVASNATGTLTNNFSVGASNGSAGGTSSIVIHPASALAQTITFNAPAASVYGGAPITLAATASSELPVSFSVSGNCTLTGSTVTITGAGSCTVTAQQAGGDGYLAAPAVIRTFTIAKAAATVTLGALTAAPVTATTIPSGLPVTITYNGSSTVPTAPGNYTVVATIVSPNYQGSVTGTLVISGAAVTTITFAPIGDHLSTDPPITLSATASSGLPVTFTIVSGPATLSGDVLTITGAGTVVVQASVAGNANYLAALLTQTFVVTSATQPTIGAVVNSASYATGQVTAGYISALFGTNMATGTFTAATTPLPSTLGGVTITILDASGQTTTAPLFYVSPGQINFLVPDTAQPGSATLTLTIGSQTATLPLLIGGTHPGIYTANSMGTGPTAGNAFHLTTAGATSYTPTATCSGTPVVCVADPIQFLTPGERVFLVLYGTGFRGRSSLANVTVTIGGNLLTPLFAGPQGDFDGLDQLNVEIPASMVGTGLTSVLVTVDGVTANPVQIAIQ